MTSETRDTRERILDAAEKEIREHGYHGASLGRVIRASGMTKGALYHHFATKRAVFEGVFRRASDAAIARATRGVAQSDSPLESLVQVCLRWLREVRKPAVGAIVIEQGPQVLGWKRARDLEARTSLGLMIRGIEAAERAGELEVESAELAARFLNAALAEAALASLHRRPRVSKAAIERAIRQVIEGLGRRID